MSPSFLFLGFVCCTAAHLDVQWHLTQCNVGWMQPSQYHWIPTHRGYWGRLIGCLRSRTKATHGTYSARVGSVRTDADSVLSQYHRPIQIATSGSQHRPRRMQRRTSMGRNKEVQDVFDLHILTNAYRPEKLHPTPGHSGWRCRTQVNPQYTQTQLCFLGSGVRFGFRFDLCGTEGNLEAPQRMGCSCRCRASGFP